MTITDEMMEAAMDVPRTNYFSEHDWMRAAITAALSAQWRTIETAPRDGTALHLSGLR